MFNGVTQPCEELQIFFFFADQNSEKKSAKGHYILKAILELYFFFYLYRPQIVIITLPCLDQVLVSSKLSRRVFCFFCFVFFPSLNSFFSNLLKPDILIFVTLCYVFLPLPHAQGTSTIKLNSITALYCKDWLLIVKVLVYNSCCELGKYLYLKN